MEGGLDNVGHMDVVAINRGERDGIKIGNTLAIYKAGEVVRCCACGAVYTVLLDGNHPLAGRTLKLTMTITEVRPATAEAAGCSVAFCTGPPAPGALGSIPAGSARAASSLA